MGPAAGAQLAAELSANTMIATFLKRGGLWVIVQSALMLAVIVLGVVFPGEGLRWAIITAGGALFVLGGVFGIAGVIALGRNRTPFPRPPADAALVRHGIYRHVRHPLYTSVVLACFGWAGLWQSWPALVASAALIPFFGAKARREEQWLRRRFPDYADYARGVPRFLPRWPRRPKGGCNF